MEWAIIGSIIASAANDDSKSIEQLLSCMCLFGSILVPIMLSFAIFATYNRNEVSKSHALTALGLNATVLALMVLLTLKMPITDSSAFVAPLMLGLVLIIAILMRRKSCCN